MPETVSGLATYELIFPKGIPGFEEYTTYRMMLEEDAPLARMRAVEDEDCGFVLLLAQTHFPGYLSQIDLDDRAVELLGLSMGESVEVWVMLTLNADDPLSTTANLRAPIIVNPKTKTAVQTIIDSDDYSSRHPLFTAAPEQKEGE